MKENIVRFDPINNPITLKDIREVFNNLKEVKKSYDSQFTPIEKITNLSELNNGVYLVSIGGSKCYLSKESIELFHEAMKRETKRIFDKQ